ncbi:LysR family transcriptional regulator [Paenibacillus silagei]|uniref:DNA-binding transcriptional LysR family regulator n=1 Tax=Paenibacillus silagei TaxID=1670801 RepID=A0ABS4NPL1_9BACL|nr:LysR family transcriptional regulator [Paenibacillus silagei]MBP2112009.1 DNA-binding transcriptional LysR family regulator [Paenibacillus silagei]
MYFPGIEAFLAIVRTGSISKAADLLHLSQATVSYRLKTLEQGMGGLLVERRKGAAKISLTPKGENFFSIAERWEALWRETQILKANGSQLSLAISAAESISHFVLPPVYRMLNQHTPSIRLQIRTQHTQEAFDSIERREMDVAFVVREIVSPSVTVQPFFTEEMVLLRLAVPGRQAGDTVEMEELAAEHEVLVNWNREFQFRHDQWWDPLCPSRVHLDSAGLITTFLTNARQWTIVPASIGAHMKGMGEFVLQKLAVSVPPRVGYKVTHKFPNQALHEPLQILDNYLQIRFGHQ